MVSRPANIKRRKRKLNGPTSQFSYTNVVVALTVVCWFASLLYCHYQINLVFARGISDEDGPAEVPVTETYFTNGFNVSTIFYLHEHWQDYIQEHSRGLEADPIEKPATLPGLQAQYAYSGMSQLQQQQDQNLEFQEEEDTPAIQADEKKLNLMSGHKFLIFEGESLRGQGVGNLMSGLLAVHLLGMEYNRTVCVVPEWHFHKAFDLIDQRMKRLCEDFFIQNLKNEKDVRLELVNYIEPPDECMLQEILASEEKCAIYIKANTYCRWRTVPPNFFFWLYKAKKELLAALSYDPDNPPKTVVHLRLQDGEFDLRRGLDKESLVALGVFFSKEAVAPYLVTNHVAWFDYFEKEYSWSHPAWKKVTHSALRVRTWGSRNLGDEPINVHQKVSKEQLQQDVEQQEIQLWSDWYTILCAKRVYHTHSDFSLSAIHWMGSHTGTNNFLTWSRTILGVDPITKELMLTEESFVTDTPMPRLVDRVGDQLHFCKNITTALKGY